MDYVLETDFSQLVFNYRRKLPGSTALKVLDAVMDGRRCRLTDFEPKTLGLCTPLGDILAGAFDKGMEPGDWRLATHPSTPSEVKSALRGLWESEVLAKFAQRYQLG